MSNDNTILFANGDGIGPEIMEATLSILEAAKVPLQFKEIKIGLKVYEQGETSGIPSDAWSEIAKHNILLKAPITTPQGGGVKSLNVTLRKTLGLFSNVRPVRSYSPYVKTKHPEIDLFIVRENEEDLYAGIEHRQTNEVYQCLKLITKPGSERIIRYAFDLCRSQGRKKLTCMSKDNIMKLTDGLFHQTFDEVAKEYPEVETDHMIIDIGSARLANHPELFDVIVLPNLYGDILSDIAAEVSGSVGLCGSANIGKTFSMFEAIHGSAPDIAGKGIANPTGLINASVMMLQQLGITDKALLIENAVLRTIEDGYHPADIFDASSSKTKLSTKDFAKAVIDHLGEESKILKARTRSDAKAVPIANDSTYKLQTKTLDGMDVFIAENDRNPNNLAEKLHKAAENADLKLLMITNRGVKVYPDGNEATFCTDHWRCRFIPKDDTEIDSKSLVDLQAEVVLQNLEIIKTENLYSFDGQKGYSLGQGQ